MSEGKESVGPSSGAPPVPPGHADGYVPTLDGWRALAVLGVIVCHFTVARTELREMWIWQILRFGRYGVDVFFAISGLLITSRLLDELRASGSISLRAFYIRRALRILPAAFVFLTVVSAWSSLADPRPTRPIEWIACALFFRNYVAGSHVTGHLWSLSVEEHFYLVWPAVLVLLARRKAYVWVIAGPLLVITWRSLVLGGVLPDPIDPTHVLRNDFRSDFRLDALLWGASAALAVRDPGIRRAVTARLGRVAWLLAVGTFLAGDYMSFELGATLQALSAPLIVLGTVLRPTSLRARILETRALRWIGRLSYGIYLLQQTFVPWVFDVPFGWAFILPAACASYYVVERPLLQLGRDLAARRRAHGFARQVALAIAVGAAGTCAVVVGFEHARLRGQRVIACPDDDFRGACVELGVGAHVLAGKDAPLPADTLSSLRVGEGATANLCTQVGSGRGGGDCWDQPAGAWVQTMGDRNDRVSFIEVVPRP